MMYFTLKNLHLASVPKLLEFVNPALDIPGVRIGYRPLLHHQLHRLVCGLPHADQDTASHCHAAMYSSPAMNQDTITILDDGQGGFHATLQGGDRHGQQGIIEGWQP